MLLISLPGEVTVSWLAVPWEPTVEAIAESWLARFGIIYSCWLGRGVAIIREGCRWMRLEGRMAGLKC